MTNDKFGKILAIVYVVSLIAFIAIFVAFAMI